MREILYRGKSFSGVINHSWLFGSLDTTEKECQSIIYIDRFGNRCRVFIDPETIGQYTSLTDKNGKKIFEGDIVKLILDNGEIRFFKVSIKKVKRYVISYSNFADASSYVEITGVVFEWNGFQLFPCIDENGIVDYSKMEIVGNIHDNPELLKEAEQE